MVYYRPRPVILLHFVRNKEQYAHRTFAIYFKKKCATIDPCRASVDHVSIDIWTDCLSTLFDRQVDRVSTTFNRYVGRVSIAGIDRHSGAFSTHDPA